PPPAPRAATCANHLPLPRAGEGRGEGKPRERRASLRQLPDDGGAVLNPRRDPADGRIMRGKRTRRPVWILRGALATLGLAGAVYAADQVTAPPPPDDVSKTITEQRVKEGTLATPPDLANQKVKLTPEQML